MSRKLCRADSVTSAAVRTFRDHQGTLYEEGTRILREVYPQHAEDVLSWIESPLARRWMQEHRLMSTEILASEPDQRITLEHERVFFPSYPWEWTPGQWISAATLTLDLCEEALDEGFILKDATSLNILFSGSRPILVDVLSLERRDSASPIWLAYAQFARTFLLPLAAYVYLGWPLAATQQRRDGYEPADLAPWLSVFRRWRYPLRSLVTLPLLLEGSFLEKKAQSNAYRPNVPEDVADAILRRTLRTARRQLDSLRPP